MSKIFLILSAVLLLVSGGLSVLNKNKLSASQDDAKAAHSDASAAHADATKSKTAMTKAQTEAKDATEKAAAAQTALTASQSQVTKLESDVKVATDATAAKDAQLKDLTDKLAAAGATAKPGEQIDIAKQIEDLKREKDEITLVKDGLDTELKGARAQVAALTKKNADRETGVSMIGLRGRVLAVDRNWNFVVLNIGDRNGLNNNATLLIQRGDNLVGKVRITSVEPSQSIADIIPNSVPAGVSVQAGDTVVYPGS